MRFKKLCCLSLLFLAQIMYAGNWLTVHDPRGWKSGQGTIEEAILAIHPRGLYMECGLYLTFSARGLNMLSTDTLEVEFQFDLPPKAIVHNSWLWIGEDIIQAKMLDKWTASQIYEGIVKRRRDPSVLFKRDQTHYEFRIFPMPGRESRKIKITYLVPAEWTTSFVQTSLPMPLLQTSRYPVAKFYLLTWLAPDWKNPRICEIPEIPFAPAVDEKYGNYYRTQIVASQFLSTLNFAVDAPYKNGIYLNHYASGKNKIYQLVALPSKVFNLKSRAKVMFAIDYQGFKTNIMPAEIVTQISSLLLHNFTASDSFNIIYSRLNVQRASEKWLPADSATVQKTGADLAAISFSAYGNLPALLANACDFIRQNGNSGTLLIIANSDQVGEYQLANLLLADLDKMQPTGMPIHVIDYQNSGLSSRWIGNISYQGNEYFYQNITMRTSGNYFNIRTGSSLTQMFNQFIQALTGRLTFFDLHTRVSDGICFARYPLFAKGESVYLNSPIIQIGKYEGSFPFILELGGSFQSELLFKRLEIAANEMATSDSLLEEMWAGNFLQSLESGNQTNAIVREIINYSLSERILSLHTALLCLEPQLGGQILSNPWDESDLITSVTAENTPVDNDTLIQAYPNPFNEQTHIKIQFAKSVSTEKLSFKIYNILGQVVRSFEPYNLTHDREFEFAWNGISNEGLVVPSGVYFFVMEGPGLRKSLKLLLLK